MATPKTYAGVSGIARTVKKIYAGVNGTARQVKKVYAGVNGIARLVYVADWFTNNGTIPVSNVLGAYSFKGAASAADALKDLTGHGKTLTNNGCSWSSGSGFWISIGPKQYLDSSALRAAGIKSFVMKIANGNAHQYAATALTGNWTGTNVNIWLNTPFCCQSFSYWNSGGLGIAHQNGLSVEYSNDYGVKGTLPMNYVRLDSAYSNGVLGFTLSNETLYNNGSAIGMSNASKSGKGNWHGFIAAGVPRLIGGVAEPGANNGRWDWLGKHSFNGAFNVLYAAFYNINLSQTQHSQIAAILNNQPY